MLMGGLLGGGLGLYQDPGEDEQGRKRSRLANALGLGLGGAAIGGTSAYFSPEASQFGRNAGARLGSLLGGLKYDLSKMGNDRADKARTKKAVHVEEGGWPTRLLASTIGRINPASLATLLMTRRALSDPSRDLLMRQDLEKIKRHEQTAKLFDKYDPEAVKDTVLRLGGSNAIDDIIYQKDRGRNLPWYNRIGGRIWQNPRTSIAGKLLGTVSYPYMSLLAAVNRGSNYNPFNDVATVYQNEDPMVEHELGHALDYNKLFGVRPSAGKGVMGRIGQELKGAARDAYMAAYKMVPGFNLVPEAQANIESQKALNYSLKDDPEELHRRTKRRLEVLPAGYATYVASSIPGLNTVTVPATLAAMGIGKALGLSSGAVYDKMYRETASASKPRLKAAGAIELLACLSAKQARCWEGYEPVPGKKPYSEDSCRPAGSGDKKSKTKEKKAFAKLIGHALSAGLKSLPDPRVTPAITAIGALTGGGIGAAAGALFPDQYEEENEYGQKQLKTRSRLASALRFGRLGALSGGALGLGKGLMDQLYPNLHRNVQLELGPNRNVQPEPGPSSNVREGVQRLINVWTPKSDSNPLFLPRETANQAVEKQSSARKMTHLAAGGSNFNPTQFNSKAPGNVYAGGLGGGLNGSAIGNNHGQAAGTNAAAVPGKQNLTKKAYDLGQGLGSLSLRTLEKQANWSSYLPAIAALGVGGLAGYGLGRGSGYDSGLSSGYDQGYDEGIRISDKDNMRALMRGLHQVMQQGRNSDVPLSDMVGHDDDYASKLELDREHDEDHAA
jgi:hypothetical protein